MILDKPNGKLKEEIEVTKMRHVEAPIEDELGQSMTKSMVKLSGGIDNLVIPTDYPYSFSIYLPDRTMLLWAKTPIERSFWVENVKEMIELNRKTSIFSDSNFATP